MRIVTTAFVKAGHTVRFTRCATCIDAKLAAAILCAYGTSAHIPSTPNVDPDDARDIRATIARIVESERPKLALVENIGRYSTHGSATSSIATRVRVSLVGKVERMGVVFDDRLCDM